MTPNSILHSFTYALDYLREQVADVDDSDLVKQPHGIPNHPAWIIGHLTFTFQMLGGAIGLAPWLPDDFEKRFGTGSAPVSDARAYDDKSLAIARLTDAQSRITRAVESLDESQLHAAFPDPAYRDVFPSIRHALTQILVGHTSFHVGQISIWRRAMNLPRMTRGFE